MQISFWFSDSLAAKDSQMDNFILLLAMNDSLKYLTIKVTSSNLCILIFRNILHLKKQKRKKETKINQTNKMLSLKTKVIY